MIKMKKPDIDYEEVYLNCISTFKDKNIVSNFRDSLQSLLNYNNDFDIKMKKRTVQELSIQIAEPYFVNGDEMIKLYNNKLVKSKKGRKYYDQILSSSPKNRCPLCGVREVSTLDHYLEKSKYPYLSVSPYNLVPSCKDCNYGKKTKHLETYEDIHLHPYYDQELFEIDEVWLKAKLTFDSDSYTVTYSVEKPSGMHERIFKKIKLHFETFNLNNAYSFRATEEVDSGLYFYRKIFEVNNLALLEYFKELFVANNKINPNSWKTALYRELKNNIVLISNLIAE